MKNRHPPSEPEKKRGDPTLANPLDRQAPTAPMEERLYAILSNIYAGLLVMTADDRVEFANQSFCELYGLDDSPESLRGLSSAGVMQKTEKAYAHPLEAVARIKEIIAQGKMVIGEELALRDGRTCIRDFIPIMISGVRQGCLWHHREITQLKQAEAETRNSEVALSRQIELFASLLKNLPIGVFMVEAPSGKPLVANDTALRLLGRGILPDVSRENLAEVYKAFKQGTNTPYPLEEMPILIGMSGRTAHVDDMTVERPDGTRILLEVFGAPVMNERGQVWASLTSFVDITSRWQNEQKIRLNETRLKGLVSILQYRAGTTQELLDRALNEVIQLTESKLGYIYFYHEDHRKFVLNTWSKEVMKECAIVNPQTTYDLDKTGIWGEAVRQRRPIILNDFLAAHPLKKGYPEGHSPLTRFMTVPVFKGDSIVAVVGVANKATNYDETDVLQLTLLMDAVWKFVDAKKGEEALRESEERHRIILQTAMDGFWLLDRQGHLVEVNETYCRMSGYDHQELLTMCISDLDASESPEQTVAHVQKIVEHGEDRFESRHRRKDGSLFDVEISAQSRPDTGGRIVAFIRDITDRKRAEEQNSRLEEQLRQSQKMESVGRLAGGVAHDFNNMLGVILGHVELALEELGPAQSLSASLIEIKSAAERSADLTKQLLAFARKQTVTPKVLDLNVTIAGMHRMLERLIGENIRLDWRPGVGLWPVRVDPSQVDQILANLCVNARDAITDVGRIIIETANLAVDELWCASHAGFTPGEFVQITVSDDGCGMTRETLSHVFEPFFTTKGQGKGTGLGLATAYGAIRQNGGFITVYSEPGRGTTFKIFLPRHADKATLIQPEKVPGADLQGHETILLVEDEPAILGLATVMLKKQGYAVLSAATPGEAMRLAREHPGEIHLLMTDVVMPEMNGRDLARNLLALYPGLKCLFMSGYTADIIAHHGVLDEGVCFIQKPFSMKDLATQVREALKKRNGGP